MTEAKRGVALPHPGHAEIQAAYERHVTAVGEVAFHWNLLHERLGELFGMVAGTTREIGMAIWYSVQSDRGQRAMLLAAVRACEADRWKRHPKAPDDLKWLADYVNNSLADRRNDAVHAPCEAQVGVFEGKNGLFVTGFEIGTAFYLGNPRAKKLAQKHLVTEFEWYAETAQALTLFCDAVIRALTVTGGVWPERPRLPSLGQMEKRAKRKDQ